MKKYSSLKFHLQESLGGNAITIMFATLSPDNKSHQDNLHTLQLAVMAKNVKNKVKMNLVSLLLLLLLARLYKVQVELL